MFKFSLFCHARKCRSVYRPEWRSMVGACGGGRTITGSALFIPGRLAEKHFRVFSPEVSAEDIGSNRDLLRSVIAARGEKEVDLARLESDLTNYQRLRVEQQRLVEERERRRAELKSIEQGEDRHTRQGTDTQTLQGTGTQTLQGTDIQTLQGTDTQTLQGTDTHTLQGTDTQTLQESGTQTQLRQDLSRLQDQLTSLKELSAQLTALKERIVLLEDSAVIQYLNLPNCDETTRLESRCVHQSCSATPPLLQPLNHVELIERHRLAEFSSNSHTAVYLHDELASLELGLMSYLQQTLLGQDWDLFSNPDFAKSVVVEGCGADLDSEQLFNLKPCQEFGEIDSLNAMYLVGGASTQPFVAYFARNILKNPSVLPFHLFSLGRQYRPVSPSKGGDLISTQQSTAVQVFSLSATKEEMLEHFNKTTTLLISILQEFGELKVYEVGAAELERSQVKNLSFQLYLPGSKEFIQVGNLGVENDYFSRRVMMKQLDDANYRNLWTFSGTFTNITRLLAVILENFQTAIDFKRVHSIISR